MQYQRDIANTIKRLAAHFPAVALTGARQVGKTTLLREIFPNYGYVSLDLPSVAEAAETAPLEFLKKHPAPFIIDEIQYAPKLFRALKAVLDENRHSMGQYILTGSQKFSLMKGVSESLAGRIGILELETLSLSEIGSQTDWLKILVRGMYPELWRQPAMRPADFFSSYVATYLERDVRQALNVSSLRDFERLLRASAARSGQLLNRTDLARDVGVASKTVGEWVSVLQASNQIFLLEPYFGNIGKRLVKSPKLYLHDSGLLCFLLGLDEQSLGQSPLLGAVWETFVYSELRKRANRDGANAHTLWFYRDAQGREIDFLKIHAGQMDVFECKWAENPERRWVENINAITQSFKKSRTFRLGDSFIVSRTQASYRLDGARIINPNFDL